MNFRRLRAAGFIGGLVLGLGAVLTFGAIEVSSTPTFCGEACHVMSPYYESWQTSSHADIACVECHIPPGVAAELEKKFEALAMVASYVTGTYGTNPWAEVEDEACLECHQRRLLSGTELFGSILFDHRPHLTEMRRGKRLRCTSCHSQIVQGSHMRVTTSTCILCHFKDQTPNEGTARCALCHLTPQTVVDREGLQFDHADVDRFGMECQSCHHSDTTDDGRVPQERCLVCHNEPARVEEIERIDFLHQTHVTDHKVECANCHLEIVHVEAGQHEPTEAGCGSCHDARHSPQRALYAGVGGKGVDPQPDVMYLAKVRCEGCHIDHRDEAASRAGELSCMSCHGPSFRTIYHLWEATLSERTSALRKDLDGSLRRMGAVAPKSIVDAEANLELVERGRGIHNFSYSLALLDAAHGQINEARAENGLSELAVPWSVAPFSSPCLTCHAGVETARTTAFGRAFSHRPHVMGREMECEACHSTHDERDGGAPALALVASDCNSCHHGAGGGACLDCHGSVLQRTFATEIGEFPHSFHAIDMEQSCTGCHGEPPQISARADRDVCADCH